MRVSLDAFSRQCAARCRDGDVFPEVDCVTDDLGAGVALVPRLILGD
jgi:hypothetical protein